LKDTVETYRSQIDEVNRHLETYADVSEKAKDMFPNIDKNIREIKDNFNMTTSSISAELGTLITDIDSSITQNGEKITNTLNHVSTSFEDQKTQIAEALQKQSNVVVQTSEEANKQLDSFAGALTSLTNSFLQNYSNFLDDAKKLMDR
jgi:ABC-type transporter Mla subunit MlaD